MTEASGPIDIVALIDEAGVAGVQDLEQEINELDLHDLADLCDPWELIGRHLRLKEADISAIKENYSSAELRRLKMLNKWRDTNLRPTYKMLIDAFLKCGKVQQALVICNKIKQLNSEGSSTRQVRTREQQPYDISSVQMSQYSSVGTVGSLTAALDHTVHTSLEESIRDLELQFSDVQRQFMRDAGVTLIELKDCIATLSSFKPGTCTQPPQILSSSSVNEFFFYLKEYCNTQSHDILDDLIKVLGDDETKKKMSDFKMEYKAFQRRTKLKDFIGKYEGPVIIPPKYKELEIKLGDNWREKTLEDLENLRCQISLINRWLLKKIEEGSLIVKYLVPDDENLLLDDKTIDNLHNQSVSYIWIDKKPVFTARVQYLPNPLYYSAHGGRYAIDSQLVSYLSAGTPIAGGESEYHNPLQAEMIQVESPQESTMMKMPLNSTVQCSHQFKVIIVGETGVGKTTILNRFLISPEIPVKNIRTTIHPIKPEGSVVIKVDDDFYVKLVLWDTAGMERVFNTIPDQLFRGVNAALIVFNVRDRKSFLRAVSTKSWFEEVNHRCGDIPPVKILVGNMIDQEAVGNTIDQEAVGNKIDQEAKRKVTTEDAIKAASRLGVDYIEASSLKNINIEKIFFRVTQLLLDRVRNNSQVSSTRSGTVVSLNDTGIRRRHRKCKC